MKRKILLSTLALGLAFAGVASAASLWGTYKGNSIIRLTVDGIPTKVSDVPAISYNGRTMVPIYLLQQAGVEYSWDGKNQTVDVKKKAESSDQSLNDVQEMITAADYYHRLMALGDNIRSFSDHFRLVLQGKSLNRDYPLDYDKFNEVIDAYNASNEESGKIATSLRWYDKHTENILNGYRDALEDYKDAFIYVEDYLKNPSDSDYNGYLEFSSKAFDTSLDASYLALDSYNFLIKMATKK